jgi:hypothetical protein
MHETIEHVLVVDLNGEKVNLEELSSAGIAGRCNTKDTVLACRNLPKNIQHIQHIGIFCGQSFAGVSQKSRSKTGWESRVGCPSRGLIRCGIDSPFLHRPGGVRLGKLDSTFELFNNPF